MWNIYQIYWAIKKQISVYFKSLKSYRVFSVNGIKLGIDNSKTSRKSPYICKLNSTLLSKHGSKEKIIREKNELNNNKKHNLSKFDFDQNSWDSANAIFEGKHIALSYYTSKEK